MIVFIGMETSGQLRRRFQAMGFETYSCDILPAEDGGEEMAYSPEGLPLGRHLVGDVFQTLEHLKANDLWPDLAIFHITCTYLTNSAAWAFNDPDYVKYPGIGYHQKVKPGTLVGAARREARERSKNEFRRVVSLPIKRKVVENPVGALSQIRKPTQIVQPYQFGDDASKGTCFWYIGERGEEMRDMIIPVDKAKFCKPRMWCPACKANNEYDAAFSYGCYECGAEAGSLMPRWANQTDTGQNCLSPGENRWKDRSRTFPGIADAAAFHWAQCCEFRNMLL